MSDTLHDDALRYHEFPTPGKLRILSSKPTETQRDLSLAYTPGVAVPCLEIARDPSTARRYTNRGNLVAVISNGTAVLGLGNIGALAGKPVMEGKCVLMQRFAGIDAIDLEVNETDPARFIEIVAALEPSFGAINLEDIKAPECFVIEDALRKRLSIPIMHDDQHGTAIVTGAALVNALHLVGKRAEDVRVVVSGAGAAALACVRLWTTQLGVRTEHVTLVDSRGVVHNGRTDLSPEKAAFAHATDARTLADALVGADVFLGVSVAGAVEGSMLPAMAEKPILFGLANPTPEFSYDEARSLRPDAIVATGRSDYPNQVNNVLAFPGIFRGALDVHARAITEGMKKAAVHALAALAREEVPSGVLAAYGLQELAYGPLAILPKPLDPRVVPRVASAVAQAASEEGVADAPRADAAAYEAEILQRLRSGGEEA